MIVILGSIAVTRVFEMAGEVDGDGSRTLGCDVADRVQLKDCVSAVLKRTPVGLSAPPSVGTNDDPGVLSTKLLLVGIIGDARSSLARLRDRLRSLLSGCPSTKQAEQVDSCADDCQLQQLFQRRTQHEEQHECQHDRDAQHRPRQPRISFQQVEDVAWEHSWAATALTA